MRYLRVGLSRPYALSRASYSAAAGQLLRHAEYDTAVLDFSAYTLVPRRRRVDATVHHLTGPSARERWGPLLGAGPERLERVMLPPDRMVSTSSNLCEGRRA